MIIFRADANSKIGSGHIMRCITIAKQFEKMGKEVMFVVADSNAEKILISNNIEYYCLNTVYENMEPEVDFLKEILLNNNAELLIIDSYFVTQTYFDELRNVCKVAYIDDMNEDDYNVDYLINYNIYSEEHDYNKNISKEIIITPKYVPLREEFNNLPSHIIKKNATDFFVSTGGADVEGVAEKILDLVCDKFENITFHLIVGALNPNLHKLIEKSKNKNVVLHINESNMSNVMQKCDLAISAAGVTLYELCASGIPTITYIMAENQIKAARAFAEKNLMINAGDCRNDEGFINNLLNLILKLVKDKQKREEMSVRMQNVVDGNGARRLADRLIKG